jgi:steroid delta-isomerase-like uncharacterized protein
MSAEENKAIIRRFVDEVFNTGNMAAADELAAPDFLDHNPFPGTPPGLEGYKQGMRLFRAAFPDLEFILEDQIAEGDKVVARWTVRATHQGEVMGIPPTGKRVTVTGIDIVRFAGGKMVESWNLWDTLGLLQQLGVMPTPGQAVQEPRPQAPPVS